MLTFKEIGERVGQVFKDNFIDPKSYLPPINAQTIAENEGLRVVFATFPNDNDYRGFIDGNTIYVNADDSPGVQNFTIAHELGHWVLHQKQLKKKGTINILYNKPMALFEKKDYYEKEADQFAARLLVPVESLKRFAKLERNNASELADTFMVSETVMNHRLRDENI